MARLTAAYGSSHSVMLMARVEDWQYGFPAADAKNRMLFNKVGDRTSYDELLRLAPAGSDQMATPELMAKRYHEAQAAMDHMRDLLSHAPIDVLIICGDDHQELFRTTNLPAIAICYGETIRNAKQSEVATDQWYKLAQMQRLEPEAEAHYPIHSELAEWMIRQLSDLSFDVTAMKGIEPTLYEGHALSFIHRRYLPNRRIPVVPILINTYTPPNQPTPKRCLEFGRALRALIDEYPEDIRIGILASGGLSHFVVDEDLDHKIINGIRNRDFDFLAGIEPKLLQAGSSEIRNWLIVAEAAHDLELGWVSYIPAYRTPALTGTGLCFAEWTQKGGQSL